MEIASIVLVVATVCRPFLSKHEESHKVSTSFLTAMSIIIIIISSSSSTS